MLILQRGDYETLHLFVDDSFYIWMRELRAEGRLSERAAKRKHSLDE